MKHRFDVLIIGAGPAGTAAAHTLAKAGFSTAILEKTKFPRYKTCGGGLTRRTLNLLGLESCPVSEQKHKTIELNFSASDQHYQVNRPLPIVEMVMRDQFDHWMAKRAIDAGATLNEECKVTNIQIEPYVQVETNRGSFEAQYLIGADGVYSEVAKKLKWVDNRHLIPAIEYETFVEPDILEKFSKTTRFDFDQVPFGYGWVFPKKNHLSIGVGTFKRHSVDLHELTRNYIKSLIPDSKIIKIEKHGFMIPVKPRTGALARGSVLLVGDAAGLADPITAEGIYSAIKSGQLCGESIALTKDNPSQTATTFQSAVHREILAEYKTAETLSQLLYYYPRLRKLAFRYKGTSLCEKFTDIVEGTLNYKTLLKKKSSLIPIIGRLIHPF